MPRRSPLSAADRDSLFSFPSSKDELIRLYTLSKCDLSLIGQHRGSAQRPGFAIQLCYLRFPGFVLGAGETPFPPLLRMVASQLQEPVESWDDYGQRGETRREHLLELQAVFGFKPFTMSHYRQKNDAHADRSGHADRQGHRPGQRVGRRSPAAKHPLACHKGH